MMTTSDRGSSRFMRRLWVILVVVLLLGQGIAFAEQSDDDEAFLVAKGRVTYRVYCINCHGAKGRGDGTLAELLTVKPSDLTQISKSNEGKFPSAVVTQIVDGRKPTKGHGSDEMPVWGDVFQTSSLAPPGSKEDCEARAEGKVKELVLYLETIQEP